MECNYSQKKVWQNMGHFWWALTMDHIASVCQVFTRDRKWVGCPVNPVFVSVFRQPCEIWILLSGDGWPLCLIRPVKDETGHCDFLPCVNGNILRKAIFAIRIITTHWNATGLCDSLPVATRTNEFHMNYAMAANDLLMQDKNSSKQLRLPYCWIESLESILSGFWIILVL